MAASMSAEEISKLTSFVRKWVGNAVRLGVLVKPDTCEKCGREAKLEASHSDYSKPLDVRWLCISCHRREDYENPKMTAAAVAALAKMRPPPRRCLPAGWWTKERIVEAFRKYADGDIPPRAMLGLTKERPDDFPPTSNVLKVFGSWSAATAAAGFTPRRRGEVITRRNSLKPL